MNIKMPFIAMCDDYHDFTPMARLLTALSGQPVYFEELGAVGDPDIPDVDYRDGSLPHYYARFYISEQPMQLPRFKVETVVPAR